MRYDYSHGHFEENHGNTRLSWYESDADNIQTSIDYHHGLSVDEPQQLQVCCYCSDATGMYCAMSKWCATNSLLLLLILTGATVQKPS